METFQNILLFNLSVARFSHSVEILEEINTFFMETNGIMLFAEDLEPWKSIAMHFPLLICVENCTGFLSTSYYSGAIVDVRNTSEFLKSSIILSQKRISQLMVLGYEELDETMLFSFKVCDIVILTIIAGELTVRRVFDPCHGIGTLNLRNQQCQVNISFLDFPPNVIFTGERLSGFEGLMWQTTADHLGLLLNYVNRHESGWGAFDPPSGLMGDIATGSSLAGVGALYPFVVRWEHAELVFGCCSVDLSWAVPSAAGKAQPTWFVVLFSELSPVVWYLTLLTLLALVIGSEILNSGNSSSSGMFFYVLALFIGVPQTLKINKGVSISIIVFGFLITSFYQSIMSSKLTVPAKHPEITTLEELAASGLRFIGPPSGGTIVHSASEAFPHNRAKKILSEKFEFSFIGLDEVLPMIAIGKDTAFIRHAANINYHADQVRVERHFPGHKHKL